MKNISENPEISIVLPCLNEEGSVIFCLEKIKAVLQHNHLQAEVIIVDNHSTDRSAELIEKEKINFPELILLKESRRGYGSAYLKGLAHARGEYICMFDLDGSYDFAYIPRFVKKMRDGADMVIGNRFAHKMEKGVMPLLHYFGSPLLSGLVRWFFGVKVRDVHCGARAITKSALKKITLYTAGMEFASEMIIKAAKAKLKIEEISIHYHKRIGESKLESFSDGWRHLRFILLYSPFVLFLTPGLFFFIFGGLGMFYMYFENLKLFNVQLYFHPMFVFSFMMILGYQLIFFTGFSKVYAVTHLGDNDKWIEGMFKYITIERAGFAGLGVALLGVLIYVFILTKWIASGFGALNETKNAIIALTILILGVQTFFSAFMLSTLGIKEK